MPVEPELLDGLDQVSVDVGGDRGARVAQVPGHFVQLELASSGADPDGGSASAVTVHFAEATCRTIPRNALHPIIDFIGLALPEEFVDRRELGPFSHRADDRLLVLVENSLDHRVRKKLGFRSSVRGWCRCCQSCSRASGVNRNSSVSGRPARSGAPRAPAASSGSSG